VPQAVPERDELLLPYPHAGQQHVRRTARRFNWLSAGRRWRKTSLVMAIAAEAALSGEQVFWGAPVYDQVRIGWNELRHGAARIADFNQSSMTARFPSGGSVTFRSLDNPDSARGHTASGIVLDETADIKPDAWLEVLRPMLLDTGGWLWAVGSPRGMNWFWQEWMAARDRAHDSMCWQAPTLGVAVRNGHLVRQAHPLENPNIPFAEIEETWSRLPERTFAQEILAEFIETGGGVFRNVRAIARLESQPPQRGHQYVFGVDLGMVNDFTAICVFDSSTQEQVALDRFNQVDWEIQLERVGEWADAYHPSMIVVEANSMGGPLAERLERGYRRLDGSHRSGLPVMRWTSTNASKREVIDGLALAIETGSITLLDDPIQTAELLAYDVEKLPSGMLRFGAPSGLHDDTVVALAIAVAFGQTERFQGARGHYRFTSR
jgi:hypothetical protein